MSRVGGHVRKTVCVQASLLVTLLFSGTPGCLPQVSDQRPQARFTSFEEATATLKQYNGSGLAGSNIGADAQWDLWIRGQDAEVRSRIDRGVEDSISNFILYGVSFTKLPRLSGSEDVLDERGSITRSAQARIDALLVALERAARNERVEFIREFLSKRKIPRADFDNYLLGNLVRFAREQRVYQKTLDQTSKSGDANQLMSVRGSLYKGRGLSADTSLLPNFAIEETLRAMTNK